MGTYNIPRNVKGEGRILFVFSTKSLIYSVITGIVGLPFYFIFNAFNMTIVGIIIVALLGDFVGIMTSIISRNRFIKIHKGSWWRKYRWYYKESIFI